MSPREFVGGHIEQFQDPAMNKWVTINSLNETFDSISRVRERISNYASFLFSTIIALFSTYFLSVRNWPLVLLLLITIEIVAIREIRKRIRHLNELSVTKKEIVEMCHKHGINLPSNALK